LIDILISFEYFIRYCLLGSSGAGKTTLFLSLLGAIKTESGTIRLFNQEIKYQNRFKLWHRIGYMPQEFSLVSLLTVQETFSFFGNLYEMVEVDIKSRFQYLKNILELPDNDQLISLCSGGMQRRISLAVAVFHSPTLLFLDE
jgi:ABC-2 type transport system ATP-binding protein